VSIVVAGSLGYDYIMVFPGYFKDHILPDKLHQLSVSFLVNSMTRQRGGCAGNIAYNLSLLGERPRIMGTVGQDFAEYRRWLETQGIDTTYIVEVEDEFTATCTIITDMADNQIAGFYSGAMSMAHTLSFRTLDYHSIKVVIISPNDPSAMVRYSHECRELSIPYIYDPGQQIVRLSGKELVDGVLGAKMLIVNDYEFEMIRNKTGLSEEDVLDLTEVVIITKGEHGSVIETKEKTLEIPIVKPRQVADPTGAGDAYRAGIIKGYVHGCSLDTMGKMGSLTATYAIEAPGTQNHRYTWAEFAARYRENFGDELAQLGE
jgi:adenosine kinase